MADFNIDEGALSKELSKMMPEGEPLSKDVRDAILSQDGVREQIKKQGLDPNNVNLTWGEVE